MADGLSSGWPHAGHRKSRSTLAGNAGWTEVHGLGHAPGLLVGTEWPARRLRLADVRHGPEHLSHIFRTGRLRRRPGSGAREAGSHGRSRTVADEPHGDLAPDAQGQGRPGRWSCRFRTRWSISLHDGW